VPPRKCETVRLSVFKGREAKLNRAIFEVLIEESPLATWDILRNVCKMWGFKRTKYAVINARIKALEDEAYLKKTGNRDTKQGGKTILYELCAKTKLAIALNARNLDDILDQLDEKSALTILKIIHSCK
jgi:hypothetical protein